MALERLENCEHIGKLCEELGIHVATLARWRNRAAGLQPTKPVAQRASDSLQQENERLKQVLAE